MGGSSANPPNLGRAGVEETRIGKFSEKRGVLFVSCFGDNRGEAFEFFTKMAPQVVKLYYTASPCGVNGFGELARMTLEVICCVYTHNP
ncbi:hypothetical protein Tco_1066178 [Tanacetum coccineum]